MQVASNGLPLVTPPVHAEQSCGGGGGAWPHGQMRPSGVTDPVLSAPQFIDWPEWE